MSCLGKIDERAAVPVRHPIIGQTVGQAITAQTTATDAGQDQSSASAAPAPDSSQTPASAGEIALNLTTSPQDLRAIDAGYGSPLLQSIALSASADGAERSTTLIAPYDPNSPAVDYPELVAASFIIDNASSDFNSTQVDDASADAAEDSVHPNGNGDSLFQLVAGPPVLPLSQQSPFPSGPSPRLADPKFPLPWDTPGLGQPTGPGVAANFFGLLQDFSDYQNLFSQNRLYNDFINSGGVGGIVLRDSQSSNEALLLYDSNGGYGIRMQDGNEFWKARLNFDPNPITVNLEIRYLHDVNQPGDTVVQYKYGNARAWTTQAPTAYQQPRWPF